jgi:hypothetical protein
VIHALPHRRGTRAPRRASRPALTHPVESGYRPTAMIAFVSQRGSEHLAPVLAALRAPAVAIDAVDPDRSARPGLYALFADASTWTELELEIRLTTARSTSARPRTRSHHGTSLVISACDPTAPGRRRRAVRHCGGRSRPCSHLVVATAACRETRPTTVTSRTSGSPEHTTTTSRAGCVLGFGSPSGRTMPWTSSMESRRWCSAGSCRPQPEQGHHALARPSQGSASAVGRSGARLEHGITRSMGAWRESDLVDADSSSSEGPEPRSSYDLTPRSPRHPSTVAGT